MLEQIRACEGIKQHTAGTVELGILAIAPESLGSCDLGGA